MFNGLDKKTFESQFPLATYGHTMLKVLLNDIYRMELTQEDLTFLKELNMIGGDDFEITALKNEYLEAGIHSFFTECSQETDKDIKNYINKRTMLLETDKTKEKELNEEIEI